MSPIIIPGAAAPVLFKLGNLDLTAYTRLYGDAGFDPYDTAGFLEPQFNDSTLAAGQPLVNVTEGNRVEAFPLFLHEANKDDLHALVRAIHLEIANTRPLRVTWQDHDASDATFYDVAYARFEPAYDFPKARAGWLGGTLRVWCQPPYGHTATERIVATGLASMSDMLVLSTASVAGDVGALGRFSIVAGRGPEGNVLFAFGVSVLPNASYVPEFTASVMLPVTGATVVTNGNAVGSLAWQAVAPPGTSAQIAKFCLPIASCYAGRNRVFAVMRAPSALVGIPKPIRLQFVDPIGNYGPTSVASFADNYNQGFRLLDLGTFDLPTGVLDYGPTAPMVLLAGASSAATTLLELSSVWVLPEETTTLIAESSRDATSTPSSYVFDGVNGRAYRTRSGGFSKGAEADQHGRIPTLPPGLGRVVAFRAPIDPTYATFPSPVADTMSVEIRVREQFTFAR